MLRLAVQPDTLERHRIVARLLADARTVLDVGGTPRTLARLLPHAQVTTANVEPPADVLLTSGALPFADDSFEAVTSVDVLEHLPHDARGTHVDELRRVARQVVVVCCPVASPGHEAAEAELAAWYRAETGRPHRFLEEHVARGLPSADELGELGRRLGPYELGFHGDYRVLQRLFRLGVAARARPWTAPAFARALLAYRPSLELDSDPPATANRAFLVAGTHTPFTRVG